MSPVAHYLTTPYGQLRLFVAGSGRPVFALPGLARAAVGVAAELAAGGFAACVPDLPGTGGSAGIAVAEARAALAAAMEMLGLAGSPVLAWDLSATLVPGSIPMDAAAARAWAARNWHPADLSPREDGTHLTALHAHLRNAHVLDPADPALARRDGPPLPDAAALHEALLAAAVNPLAYADLWRACLAAAEDLEGPETPAEALALLGRSPAPPQPRILPRIPPVAAAPPVWCDHADLPRGRAHLRLAGAGGRPLVALHSAPGGAAPLAPLLHGLGASRRVIAPDYLGNGWSEKPEGRTDIGVLADDLLALLDALSLDQVDLWGTHTGALIALEASLRAPARVHRLVLEAPPLLPPAFTADILANYLPPLLPDGWGLHLQQAWNMRRDMFLFWPWYRAQREAVRPLRLPDADFLHDWTMGLLASGRSYDRSYRAAFEYDTRAALARLSRPALVCAGPADMLVEGLQIAGQLSPQVTVAATPATVWYPHQGAEAVAETLRRYADFLDG